MDRHIKDDYIPLSSSDLGESHKLVHLLTREHGLIRAAVFGARGKKAGDKRLLIQPFSLCRGDFYFDPVKKLWRLNEGECLESRDTFHLHLNRYYGALFWADLVIQSHAGGGHVEFFDFTLSFFRSLDQGDEGRTALVFLGKLWEYLELEGLRPEPAVCSRCGRRAPAGKALCYNSEGQTVCRNCRINSLPLLSPGARAVLEDENPGNPESGDVNPDDLTNLSAYILTVIGSLFRLKMNKESLSIILEKES